jgi:3-phenylpropionate/trans-cinnamate dioxygenase ferredoxin reductase subunit
VFIAGGVGITPIMSMLCTLADRDDRRSLLLIYANNTWEEITFREELEALQQQLDLEIVHVLGEPPDGWDGETGYVTADILERLIPAQRNSRAYFICGPDPMMDAVEQGLTELGVSLANIHGERYNFV